MFIFMTVKSVLFLGFTRKPLAIKEMVFPHEMSIYLVRKHPVDDFEAFG